MIALPDDIPLVEYEDGHVVPFENDVVLRPLLKAAAKAGYPEWWLAQHVARSVSAYLHRGTERSVISIARLAQAVQAVLEVIGYAEVACHFRPDPPLIQISLIDLAREAGSGYELAFFEALGRRLHQLVGSANSRFEMIGLQGCVKLLRSRKLWSRDCEFLRAEIVAYVREQIETERPAHPIHLCLS